MQKEYRKIDENIIANDERKIQGYALVFNQLSNKINNAFFEKIDQNALDGIIEISDVFATLNHQKERGILARSKFGKGTLNLSIDEKGLKYEFDAPLTALGDETLEMIKRGDITASSFVFVIDSDSWEKQADGTYIRTIKKFKSIHDVSPVYSPAYNITDVKCLRFDEILEDEKKELEQKINEIDEIIDSENVENDESENVEITNENEPELIDGENIENEPESIDENEPELTDEKRNFDLENENKIIINNKKTMEKFKLISVIKKVAEKRELSELEQEFLNLGKTEFRKSGIAQNGEIQLPFEFRSDITATGSGAGVENVSETKLSIVEPLRSNLTLVGAGAQLMTGLVGDVSIPTYAGSSVAWKGENVSATDGAGAFGEVTLKPKRLTAYLNVSKQFLLQDSNDAEAMLQKDIMNAISEKLEQTVLGNGAGSATQPAGIFATATGTTSATYGAITTLEEALENKNVKEYSFIVNPKAKAALKAVKVNEGKMVFAENQIDGVATYATSAVYSKGVAIADFRDLVIGVWGIELTVDPYSLAGDGKVKLIVNAYVDAAFRRDSYSVINLA